MKFVVLAMYLVLFARTDLTVENRNQVKEQLKKSFGDPTIINENGLPKVQHKTQTSIKAWRLVVNLENLSDRSTNVTPEKVDTWLSKNLGAQSNFVQVAWTNDWEAYQDSLNLEPVPEN